MQVPWRRSDKFKKPDQGPVYLTSEGHERLKKELLELKKILPARIAETARTAAYGDRSDNAEYKQAKGALRWTNYRILEIEDQLKRVSVIEVGKNRTGLIRLGSIVTLETKSRDKKIFQIVGDKETRPEQGRISYESPLGSLLMNKKIGDIVFLETTHGTQQFRIVGIG